MWTFPVKQDRIHISHVVDVARPQDVFDPDDVLVAETQQDLDLPQRALAVRLVLKRADFLDGHATELKVVRGRADEERSKKQVSDYTQKWRIGNQRGVAAAAASRVVSKCSVVQRMGELSMFLNNNVTSQLCSWSKCLNSAGQAGLTGHVLMSPSLT